MVVVLNERNKVFSGRPICQFGRSPFIVTIVLLSSLLALFD